MSEAAVDSALGNQRAPAHTVRPARFAEHERRLMLTAPGIGPTVLERLEREGIASLAQLREAGVARAVLTVCASVGSIGWANRRRALERALQAWCSRCDEARP